MSFASIRPSRCVRWVLCALFAVSSSSSLFVGVAMADGSEALKLAPHGANAAMTIDVAKLIASPMGKAANLQSKLMTGYADRPLAVPATASHVTLVAAVHPTGMETIWQTAIVELSHEPRLEKMVGAQGGYLDKVAGKNAAWSKHDIYYVQLDKQKLGVARPAQRQFITRWLTGKNPMPPSQYLTNAMSTAANADVVFAVDLDGTVALPALRYAAALGDLPSLEGMDSAQETKLMTALGTVKGMKITMRATDKLDAEWVIDFAQDVSSLGDKAEAFIVDVLNAAGLNDGNADKWQFKAEGSKIVGRGSMDFDGLMRLVGLLAPGGIPSEETATADAAPAGGSGSTPPTTPGDTAKSPANASLAYYRAITKSIDSIAVKTSPTQGAIWLSAQAKAIEQMPILNVDPELITWGGQVADAYRRAAQELAMGQANATNAAQSVGSPVSSSTYDVEGNSTGTDTADSRAAYRNAQKQRRVAAQDERRAAAARALNIFNELTPTRAKLRSEMTQKYGVEF